MLVAVGAVLLPRELPIGPTLGAPRASVPRLLVGIPKEPSQEASRHPPSGMIMDAVPSRQGADFVILLGRRRHMRSD